MAVSLFQMRAGLSRRRARQYGVKSTLTGLKIQARHDQQQGRCYWCGGSFQGNAWHVDHLRPLSAGGENRPENIVIACPTCNLSRGTKTPAFFLELLYRRGKIAEPRPAIDLRPVTPAGSLPADILARLAALEAENAAIREALAEARKDRDAWHDQAQQAQAATDRALQALTNQQTLAIPGAMREMPALTDRGDKGNWWERMKAALIRKL